MSKRKQTRANQKLIYKLFRQLWKVVQTAVAGFTQWLLRTFLIVGAKPRRPASAKAGFVLPTVALLLVVVSLVITAILFRTGSRTNQVIGAREEQIIYNAATPAIERAKAKLEYLFLKDKRFPSGPPSDEMLLAMLTNKPEVNGVTLTYPLDRNPYTFKDESEQSGTDEGYLDIDGRTGRDPAWSFKIDVDGDATDGDPNKLETVIYAINLKRADGTISIEDSDTKQKAKNLVVRNGPITTAKINNPVCRSLTQNTNQQVDTGQIRPTNDADWFQVGSAKLRKTFQVYAIVISNKGGLKRTVATLEFQQDRQLDRGNKWGAWFRNDLEIFPGQQFNWNGAMYSAGNMMVGDDKFRGYLISAPNSCFFTRDASEVKVNEDTNKTPTLENPIFRGQFVSGKMGDDSFTGGSRFDVMKEDDSVDGDNENADNTKLDEGRDSVRSGAPNGRPSQIALDPVIVFTRDLSQSRGSQPSNETFEQNFYKKAGAGAIGYLNTTKRLLAGQETPPFIDDSYRADDRYGPKPYYDRKGNEIRLNNSNKRNGANITDATDKERLIKNTVDVLDTEYRTLGLDGYWERRANASGLRVIVGERLELGNPFGWVNSKLLDNTGTGEIGADQRDTALEFDRLYPPSPDPARRPPNYTHADRQRRTLIDNLAAVQGTVVYQATADRVAPERPIACIATTAHPGTRQNIDNSKNFGQAESTYGDLPGDFYSDFFTGLGTNGWEYEPPPQASSLRGGEWNKALRNLANFAGEYQDINQSGAFPPSQRGDRVYPHPYLSMWGNFSNLSRAIYESNDSIADKSYLESAACTLGMLAYNVNKFEDEPIPSGLETPLKALFGSSGNRIQIAPNADPKLRIATVYKSSTPVKTVPVTQLTPDDYIDLLTGDDQRKARLLAMKLQIARDRQLGFSDSTPAGTRTNFDPRPTPTTGTPTAAYDDIPITTTCGITDVVQLLCPEKPKFPSLYYLFPDSSVSGHDRKTGQPDTRENAEPYIKQDVYGVANLPNERDRFQSVSLDTLANDVKPKAEGSWRLPTTGSVAESNPLADFNITLPGGGQRRVSLIDNALYNGRELMTVRTLDIDLEQLRTNRGSGDTWLPTSGVVYAFREDAVREDAIARPSGGGSCENDAAIRTTTCFINANDSRDPAVIAANFISPKAVDYYADPDRRPHGFRLRNGRRIDRDVNNPRGLTFVSDNPVYIQGDFNYHSTDGSNNNLEEFRQQLAQPNWDNFYERRDLDDRFARPATDTWRPAEILGDGITILSDAFQDGSIDRGIINDTDGGVRTGNAPNGRYSFRATNGPDGTNNNGPGSGWVLENGLVINSTTPQLPTVPIKISRNGNPIYCTAGTPVNSFCPIANQREYGSGGESYRSINTDFRDWINEARQTRVNATLISGIVPSRINQSYGGFHNFPRFIENWGGKDLNISGSFVQLNFSTYATGPFEKNQWQPASSDPQAASNVEFIMYYNAPNRRWGYDVGLQYAAAGAVAQRFVQPPASRSEFYRELKGNDPYICQLRRVGNFDRAADTECPQ